MKTPKSILIVIIAICLVYTTMAQESDRRYWFVNEVDIKSDQISNFETSLKEVVRLFGENNHPISWLVFRSTGFKYYFFREIENIAEYEPMIQKFNETWSKIEPEIRNNYFQTAKTGRSFIIRDMPARNYYPEKQRLKWDEMKYAIWDVHYVKSGKDREYRQILDEFNQLCTKHNFDDPIFIIKGMIGAKSNMYAGVLYGKNPIDFRQQNQKMWESFGDEGKELYQKFLPLLEDRESIEFWRRDGLSYTVDN